MYIDPSLARGISHKHMNQWVAEGSVFRKEFQLITSNASKNLQGGSSPSKAINKTLSELKTFFERRPVEGSVLEPHGRRLEFSLRFPEMTDDGLNFSVISGHMNGRNGNIVVEVKRPLAISVHAVERLHQRIGTTEPKEILSEIYATLGHCEVFLEAGKQVGATCWPLLSKRGFFVVAPSFASGIGSLVTWMSFDQLSRKWGIVADCLRSIGENRPELLTNLEFCVEFLRSFPWMLKPHRPAVDTLSLAWQNNQFNDELTRARAHHSQKISDVHNYSPIDLSDSGAAQDNQEFKSSDYVPGLNYLSSPPPFEAHSRINGVVVQIQRSGYCIVGLRNGWIGTIPPIAIERANGITEGLGNLEIGDNISVEIRKIARTLDDCAYSVALDIAAKVDAEFSIFEHRYPKGSIVEGVIFNVLEHCCYIRFADGAVAELMKKEYSWSSEVGVDEGIVAAGRKLAVKIIGSKHEKRILKASLRQLTEDPQKTEDLSAEEWIQIQQSHPKGATAVGKIHRILPWGASIILSDGAPGFLPMKEFSWVKEFSSTEVEKLRDQLLTLKVIGIKASKKYLVLSYRQCIPHPMDDSDLCPVVGRSYEGVVSNVQDYGIFVRLPIGLEGLLHFSVSPEVLKSEVGQAIRVTVMTVDVEKRRISLGISQINSDNAEGIVLGIGSTT
jgi:ribosomal protein S1